MFLLDETRCEKRDDVRHERKQDETDLARQWLAHDRVRVARKRECRNCKGHEGPSEMTESIIAKRDEEFILRES